MAGGAKSRSKKKPTQGGGGGGIITFLFVVLPAAIFAAPTALMFVAGLIPTLVAWVVDRDREKSAGITVGALNICGILPFTMDMWRHSQTHTLAEATRLLSEPLTWMVMYGAAAIGWLFYYGVPPVVAGFEVMRAQSQIESLQNKRRALIEEWGPEVALDDEALMQQKAKGAAGAAAAPAAAGRH